MDDVDIFDLFEARKNIRGPWKSLLGTWFVIVSEDAPSAPGVMICESVAPENAALIAAAPRLLDACVLALNEDSGLACAPALRTAILAALGR